MEPPLKFDKSTSPETERRVIEGDYEITNYAPDSSMRIWLNGNTKNYSSHWHPAMEVIMPLENIYTVRVQQKEYVLQPGDILIIPAGELHSLLAPPSGTRLIFLLDFTVISKIKGFSPFLPFWSQPILISKDTSSLYQKEADLMLQIRDIYFAGDSFREPLIYSLLIHFFINLGRDQMQAEISFTNGRIHKQKDLWEKLNSVFDYLDKHYMEDLSLDFVSQIAGFSKFHFTRLFKQCSGLNFYDYLCHRRIKEAESLLMKPGAIITEIALQSGFSNISSFNRTFKKVKHCTPSEYRALCSKQMH